MNFGDQALSLHTQFSPIFHLLSEKGMFDKPKLGAKEVKRAVRPGNITSIQLLLHHGVPLINSHEILEDAADGGPDMFNFLRAEGAISNLAED